MLRNARSEPIEQDRRAAPRSRCLLRGRVAFNHKASTLDCAIRNMTDHGARLIFDDAVALPREFEVIVDSEGQKHGQIRKAEMIWSTGLQSGVVFI